MQHDVMVDGVECSRDPKGPVLQNLHDRRPGECQKVQTKQQFQWSSTDGNQTEPSEVDWQWPSNDEVGESPVAPIGPK